MDGMDCVKYAFPQCRFPDIHTPHFFMKPTIFRTKKPVVAAEALEARIAPATITVTNFDDIGLGSLRDAVAIANSTPAADTIVFSKTLSGTLTLTSGELLITTSVTVKGPGAAKIIISGNANSRIFNVNDGVGSKDTPFSISGLALINGKSVDNGGAIFSAESITVKSCTISNSEAKAGGGVFTSPHPTSKILIADSLISGNRATTSWGGGLYLDAGKSITISNTVVTGNTAAQSGGGVYIDLSPAQGAKAKAVITGSLFTRNTSLGGGGGLAAETDDHPLLISNSTFSGNTTTGNGGGLYLNSTTLTLTNSNVVGNRSGTDTTGSGAGVFSISSTLNINNSRILHNNSGESGGGISFKGAAVNKLTVSGGIIGGNTAVLNGGGINGTDAGKVIVKGTNVHSNQAASSGGGISTSIAVALEISGGIYEGNIAINGGAVDTTGSGTVLISGAKFLSNRTNGTDDGGALYLRTTTTASVLKSVFNGNSAGGNAGAIALGSSGVFTLSGLTVLNNASGFEGGGLAAFAGSTVNISSSLFKGNYSNDSGGAIGNFGGTVNISTSIITGNAARISAGGIYRASAVTIAATTKLFGNIAATNPDKNF